MGIKQEARFVAQLAGLDAMWWYVRDHGRSAWTRISKRRTVGK